MQIYFSGSIRGGRDDHAFYVDLIRFCKTHGTVLTEHIGVPEKIDASDKLPDSTIHDRDMHWLLQADIVVAEVTTPSLGVGYEIGRAVENGKPVLALYRPAVRNLSAMIGGSDKITVQPYESPAQAKAAIDAFCASGIKKSVQTLVIVHQGDRVLLGQKKKGFGAGYWNGFGGKVHRNETIAQSARRELEEECGLGTTELHKRGILHFWFHSDPVEHEVHVFSVQAFTGEPKETEEMKPQWFAISDIPYDRMWPDDVFWLPTVLAGEHVEATFWFAKDGSIEKKDVRN